MSSSWHNKLQEWHAQQLITADTVKNIEAYEANQPRAIENVWRYGLMGLAALCIGLGILFIVASNWQAIPFSAKLGTHIFFNVALGGYILHLLRKGDAGKWSMEICLLILSAAQLSLMALIGQHLQISAEIEDTMKFWLFLIAPMLLLIGKRSGTAVLFFSLTIFYILSNIDVDLDNTAPILWGASFFYFISLIPQLKQNRPGWSDVAHLIGFYSIIGLTLLMLTGAGLFWGYHDRDAGLLKINLNSAMFLTAIMGALYFYRWGNTYLNQKTGNNAIVIYSLVFAVLAQYPTIYFYIPYPILFCLYFFGIGAIAYRYHKTVFLILSIIAISGRLIIYFTELSDNMLLNGLSMIGVGLAGLVVIKKLVLKKKA